VNEDQLIAGCKANNRNAQHELYQIYAKRMFGVCRRYVDNEADVEEVLMAGFLKVFTKIDTFQFSGSFEGWIRRIMVNESLMFLRKQKKTAHLYIELDNNTHEIATAAEAQSILQANDIIKLLDYLPPGYRTVFNLYAIEGYSLPDIAEELQISVNTVKSQLFKARQVLQRLIEQRQSKIA
jgi:RNA polymerase sigma factor (sigma-70 family)